MIQLSSIKENEKNPRFIKNDKFLKLVQSIKDFPQMMEIRPIIIDENGIVQGGNMRLKALISIGYTEVPKEWIKKVSDFTSDQWKEFLIKDNSSFGNWDWDIIANEWDSKQLVDWGVDIPVLDFDGDIDFDNIMSNENREKKDNTKIVQCHNCGSNIKL